MRKFLIGILIATLSFVSCSKDTNDELVLEVSSTKVEIPSSGQAKIEVTTNSKWSASVSGTWCKISPSAGTGNGTIVLRAALNNESEAKTAVLKITSKGITKEVALIQQGTLFNVDKNSVNFTAEGGKESFNIKSNIPWEIESNVSAPWLSVSKTSGDGDAVIELITQKNAVKVSNQVLLTVKAGQLSYEVLVKQAEGPNNNPSKVTLRFPANSGVGVSRNPLFTWDASVDLDNDDIKYDLLYSRDKISWEKVSAIESTGSTITANPKEILAAGTLYYWKVSAYDNFGGSSMSDVYSFTTGNTSLHEDGSYSVYFEGKGFNNNPKTNVKLVFTGDGYTAEDHTDNGKFDQDINEAIEAFFSVEPYKSYKEYFTVYKVAAHSQERGVSIKNSTQVNTVYKATLTGGTGIECNYKTVYNYAYKIPGVNYESLKSMHLVVIINENIYAGTCMSTNEGVSVGMVPVSRISSNNGTNTLFANVVIHECGGHGWGQLADEYVSYDEYLPSSQKVSLSNWHSVGYFLNVSSTSNKTEVPWAQFIGKTGYERMGVFTGAYYYSKGAYRPEETSCMISNMKYYNAQSRWLMVKRIMKVVGNTAFTVEDFIKNDKVKAPDANTKSTPMILEPLGKPIMIWK